MNNVIDDIVDDLNNPRPVAAGGTGVTSIGALRSALNVAEQVSGGADTTAGRGLIIGSMGVGGFALTATDFNNTASGVTATIKSNTASAGNAPTAGNVWVGDQWAKNSNSAVQLVGDVADGRLMLRVKDGGVWDPWTEVRVVTQVSDDGFGNICWRYSDGYQECQWHGAIMECDTAQGTAWRSANETWTYRLPFIGSHPDVQVTARRTSTTTSTPFAALVNTTSDTDNAVTTTAATGTMMAFAEGAFGRIMYKATGYWR